jgi:hypothetical protein
VSGLDQDAHVQGQELHDCRSDARGRAQVAMAHK